MDTSLCVPGLHAVVFCNQSVSKLAYALRMFAENKLRSLNSECSQYLHCGQFSATTNAKQLIALQVRCTPMLGHDPSCNSEPRLSMVLAGKLSKFCPTIMMMTQNEKFTRFSNYNGSLLGQQPTCARTMLTFMCSSEVRLMLIKRKVSCRKCE